MTETLTVCHDCNQSTSGRCWRHSSITVEAPNHCPHCGCENPRCCTWGCAKHDDGGLIVEFLADVGMALGVLAVLLHFVGWCSAC